MARTFTIGDDHVQRSFTLDGHCLRTRQLRHGLPGGRSYTVAPNSDEFVVELAWEPLHFEHKRQNPIRLTGKDFLLVAAPEEEFTARAVFELVEPQLDLRVTLHIEADDNRPLLYKWLTITPTGREPVSISRVVVDSLYLLGPEPEHGGYGQPLYCGDWFTGVEYPTGLNAYADGAISCAHDGDGYLAVGSTVTSERVVWGGTQPGRVRDSFLDYIDQLRARPVRRYIHYNSWYDVQHDDLNEENLRTCLARLVKELHEDRGAHLAGFVIDDHWDNRGSVWEIDHKKFPNGFAKLHADLEAHNLDLGLWFGPVGGYHDERAERVAWYEIRAMKPR